MNRASVRRFVFFNDTATTEIYTLSLHDALPIFRSATPERISAFRSAKPAVRSSCSVYSVTSSGFCSVIVGSYRVGPQPPLSDTVHVLNEIRQLLRRGIWDVAGRGR